MKLSSSTMIPLLLASLRREASAWGPTIATRTPSVISSVTRFSSSSAVEYQTGQPYADATKTFKNALTYNELLEYVTPCLNKVGYETSSVLCATSLCGDEMNRPLEQVLGKKFGVTYCFGGPSGFAFGGVTAFRRIKEHIPTDGMGFIVYGPHVGLSLDGRIGHVDRPGIKASVGEHTLCCRSAIKASEHVRQVLRGEAEPMTMDPMDASQYFVASFLKPYAEKLENSADEATRMVDLSYYLMEAQTDLMNRIILEGSQFDLPGDVAVMGGIQINTPSGYKDYFLPLRFDLYNDKGEFVKALMDKPE